MIQMELEVVHIIRLPGAGEVAARTVLHQTITEISTILQIRQTILVAVTPMKVLLGTHP